MKTQFNILNEVLSALGVKDKSKPKLKSTFKGEGRKRAEARMKDKKKANMSIPDTFRETRQGRRATERAVTKQTAYAPAGVHRVRMGLAQGINETKLFDNERKWKERGYV
jgi:hypothetical protein